MNQPMPESIDKIIFTGPIGAGKTTAIASIADTKPINTDVKCNPNEAAVKKTTTVAMDYSYIQLDNGKRIHLYGTPGQHRFKFMWKILTRGGIGLIILINNDQEDPLSELEFYLDTFDDFIKETGVVVGITRMDERPSPTLEDYQNKMLEKNMIFPVFEIDGRQPNDVKILVHALLAVLES